MLLIARERSEEEDDYHLPLADSEEDDFKVWDMHNEVVVATDEEVQREDNQNKQGKDDRQENSDKEVATGTSSQRRGCASSRAGRRVSCRAGRRWRRCCADADVIT